MALSMFFFLGGGPFRGCLYHKSPTNLPYVFGVYIATPNCARLPKIGYVGLLEGGFRADIAYVLRWYYWVGLGLAFRSRNPRHPPGSKALPIEAFGLQDLKQQGSGSLRLHCRGTWMFGIMKVLGAYLMVIRILGPFG